jgi:hypothetical protein
MQQTTERINDLFTKLDTWSKLPAYQLERRVDIFFALYLSEVLENKVGGKIDYLIPEFPVRKADINPKGNNQSFKIDYIAINKQLKKIYFIELKTTQKSKRSEQDQYLIDARDNYDKVIRGIRPMQKASKEKHKYDHLLAELVSCGIFNKNGEEYVNGCPDYNIDIVYILPANDITEKLVITFKDFLDVVNTKPDIVSQRFACSLREWIERIKN